jgi:hypothetical protein
MLYRFVTDPFRSKLWLCIRAHLARNTAQKAPSLATWCVDHSHADPHSIIPRLFAGVPFK